MADAQHTPAASSERGTVLNGIRWHTYEALLKDRGDDGPRLFYDQGILEFMSPTRKHERLKTLIGRLVETFTEELGIEISGGGSTTLKSQLRKRGLEPDESYYIQNEPRVRRRDRIDLTIDPPPDLAIEVDLSSSAVDKLGMYGSLRVPELWSHDGRKLVVRVLRAAGTYAVTRRSKALPALPLAELSRFLERWHGESDTAIGRAFRAWVREHFGSA